MKNKVINIIKQVKHQSFSYGKFVVDNRGTTKEQRREAIKKFLETTRNTRDTK